MSNKIIHSHGKNSLVRAGQPPVTQAQRSIILEAARKEWYRTGCAFDDLINHVIDDARNIR